MIDDRSTAVSDGCARELTFTSFFTSSDPFLEVNGMPPIGSKPSAVPLSEFESRYLNQGR